LKTSFGLDYTWLEKYDATLPDCQSCYRSQYVIWERYNGERLEKIKKVFAAHMALSDSQVEKMFSPTTDVDLAKSRSAARLSATVWFLSTALFVIAACAFLLAAVVISRGLWIQAVAHAV
jgi:hypothetical protein